MAFLNIPSTVDDPNYRYKMPKLKAKIEGRGNGIKTNIMNMSDIARALKRPPEYPTKFCGCELGSQSKFEVAEGKAIVNGAHTELDLQQIIDKFIERFVLCPNCRLPEIDLSVAKGRVRGKCNACGFSGDMDNAHKVGTYIVKNPPNVGDSTMGKSQTGSKKQRRADKKKQDDEHSSTDSHKKHSADEKEKKNKDGEEKERKHKHKHKDGEEEKEKKHKDKEHKHKDKEEKEHKHKDKEHKHKDKEHKHKDKEHKHKDKEEKHKDKEEKHNEKNKKKSGDDKLSATSSEIQNIITRLHNFLYRAEKPTLHDFFQEVRLLQVAQDFDSATRIHVALQALMETPAGDTEGDKKVDLDADIDLEKLKGVLGYIAVVCDRSISGDDILSAFEFFSFQTHHTKQYPQILNLLYNHDILEEDHVLSRYDEEMKGEMEELERKLYEAGRAAAQPFVCWLKEADSATESEEDEEASEEGSEEEDSEEEDIDDL